jgi:hypothetical protein
MFFFCARELWLLTAQTASKQSASSCRRELSSRDRNRLSRATSVISCVANNLRKQTLRPRSKTTRSWAPIAHTVHCNNECCSVRRRWWRRPEEGSSCQGTLSGLNGERETDMRKSWKKGIVACGIWLGWRPQPDTVILIFNARTTKKRVYHTYCTYSMYRCRKQGFALWWCDIFSSYISRHLSIFFSIIHYLYEKMKKILFSRAG